MRQTLRRSCSACARSKLSCDLRTPHCSRCIKRKVLCVYANQPWTVQSASSGTEGGKAVESLEPYGALSTYQFGSIDPFDSYPQTRLPREHVRRLIHNFLHKIAFQYYPLDLNETSNPFLISWWPLALGDPALFHVSLQTACLDEELMAQRGFQASEMLMADSVSLLRRKIQDLSLAVQDGTMNSVITLAAIEFGKGNFEASKTHVEGVKRLVSLRGGISSVRQTSPLTARMITWASMLILGYPQFPVQDDGGVGDGIPPIPEWLLCSIAPEDDTLPELNWVIDDKIVETALIRLRYIFKRVEGEPLSGTRLHDLALFVTHRLLLSVPDIQDTNTSPVTECIRYALILYMFTIQGPIYYSHAVILSSLVTKFIEHLKILESFSHVYDALDLWLLTMGMVASVGTPGYSFFTEMIRRVCFHLQITEFHDALKCIKGICWLGGLQGEALLRPHWDVVLADDIQLNLVESTADLPPNSLGVKP
ncbi:hypothetical protein PMG11_01356 [Penicillium brasilianum]|uniref:Zn(2)-C6 fungal-type domain-containing protein n=1 Tax=Penicillium brasilianum TaxID=104259 RepID=A0A0F7TEA1_PENBI|nr:hypothetical protein PMG11_01356 [Penicillium brasilianum]